MDPTNPEFPEPYTFCKCGKTGCPSLQQTSDGVVIQAPDAELVTSAGKTGVPFTREQATELRELLQKLGF